MSLAWLDDLILSVLRPGERVRFGEIVRRTEAHPSSVNMCVGRLRREGALRKVCHGTYVLSRERMSQSDPAGRTSH